MKLVKHPLSYVALLFLLVFGAIGYAVVRTHLAPPAAQVTIDGRAKAPQKEAPGPVSSHTENAGIVSQSQQGEGAAPMPAASHQGHAPQMPGVGQAPLGNADQRPHGPISPSATPAAPLVSLPVPQTAPPQGAIVPGAVPVAPVPPTQAAPHLEGQSLDKAPTSQAPQTSGAPQASASAPTQPGTPLAQQNAPAPPAAVAPQVPSIQPAGKISVVVVGLGRKADLLTQALALPKETGLAFYAGQDVTPHQKDAQAKGFETFVMVPMEPLDYPQSDPGPDTLLTGLDGAENVRRLNVHLEGRLPCMGVVPFMGSRFLFSTKDLTPVMQALSQHRLIFIDTGVTLQSVAGKVSKETHTDEFKIGAYLGDGDLTLDEMKGRFEDLEALSRTKKYFVAMVEARPTSLQALHDWAATLPGKNITLVGVGSLFERSNATLAPPPAPLSGSLADQKPPAPTSAVPQSAAPALAPSPAAQVAPPAAPIPIPAPQMKKGAP